MNRSNKTEILLEVSHRLEDKFGVKSGIFHEDGSVVFENVATSFEPIIPEEIDEILKNIGEKYGLETGDFTFTVNGSNLVVRLTY